MRCAVNGFVVAATLFAGQAAVITGLAYGSMNGVLEMEGFQDTFSSLYEGTGDGNSSSSGVCSSGNGAGSDIKIGLIVSMLSFGAVWGAIMAGWLSDHFSRKYTLVVSGGFMLLGSIITSASFYFWMLIVGRFLKGVGVGIVYVVMPVYVSEMSPKKFRGFLTSSIGLEFYGGIIISLFLNVGFAAFPLGWRMAFVVIAVVALVYVVGMMFMPHTPRWLARRGRDKEALAVLAKINRHSGKETFVDTCIELKELQAATDSEISYSLLFKELFECKYRVLLMSILFTLVCVTGLFTVFYTSTFFCKVGVPPFYAALVVGIVALLGALLLTLIIDKVGRKMVMFSFNLFLFFTGLTIAILEHLDIGSDLVAYAVVLLICVYAFGFAASVTVVWVLNSEIFPINIRGTTAALASGVYWSCSAAVSLLTPLVIGSPLQLHGFFYIVATSNLVGFFIILFFLPETKGVSLEEMNELFSEGIWQRFVAYVRCNRCAEVHLQELELQGKDFKLKEADLPL